MRIIPSDPGGPPGLGYGPCELVGLAETPAARRVRKAGPQPFNRHVAATFARQLARARSPRRGPWLRDVVADLVERVRILEGRV